jgi:transposase
MPAKVPKLPAQADILNWFEARGQISLGTVEGLNNKLKANIGKSYGFGTAKALKIML